MRPSIRQQSGLCSSCRSAARSKYLLHDRHNTFAPARFSAVELHVTAKDPSAQLERLVEVADRGCIMMSTLRSKLDVRIRTDVAI